MPEQMHAGDRLRDLVAECVRRELPSGVQLPGEEEDLVESGALDSMAWVSVLRSLERVSGVANLAGVLGDEIPRSIESLLAALRNAATHREAGATSAFARAQLGASGRAGIVGWGSALGTQCVEAASVEREFGLAAGTLRDRAGIESIARVQPGEGEIDLAARAAAFALQRSDTEIADVDALVASSETHLEYPSLVASLHSRLLANEDAGAFDIGGACTGLLNALFFARSLMLARQANCVLVVTADVHSQRLLPTQVPGQFGGLFGDGASAFLLRRTEDAGPPNQSSYRLGDFQFGCVGTYASALAVKSDPHGILRVVFDGEGLARAALRELQRVIEDLELQSGLSRKTASSFATHQPNPRIVDALARQLGVAVEKFPPVAKISGNLGSSTCGVALAQALDEHSDKSPGNRGPIFLAAVGPGLVWGGGILY